jgi:hypothetical protein
MSAYFLVSSCNSKGNMYKAKIILLLKEICDWRFQQRVSKYTSSVSSPTWGGNSLPSLFLAEQSISASYAQRET